MFYLFLSSKQQLILGKRYTSIFNLDNTLFINSKFLIHKIKEHIL